MGGTCMSEIIELKRNGKFCMAINCDSIAYFEESGEPNWCRVYFKGIERFTSVPCSSTELLKLIKEYRISESIDKELTKK